MFRIADTDLCVVERRLVAVHRGAHGRARGRRQPARGRRHAAAARRRRARRRRRLQPPPTITRYATPYSST